MTRSLTLEEINDIEDAKFYPVTIPTTEDVYASMMQQQANKEGHRGRAPSSRQNHETDTSQVVAALKKHGQSTRVELAAILGIGGESVYHYVNMAIRKGEVVNVNPRTQRAAYRLANQ